MSTVKNNKNDLPLFEVKCPHCEKTTIWIPKKAKALCSSCYRWIKFDEAKATNPCHQTTHSDQLNLF